MCGIAGFISSSPEVLPVNLIDQICKAIYYRGRDDQGHWSDGTYIHLFHSRLSIIDLKTGMQPMKDHSGRYIIIFNGEIYNYLELRGLYAVAGASFHTHSDTEVILEGFKLKGEKVCHDLNGMFAFAIWDTVDKNLFLARDRLGKKPFYWTVLGKRFYFASSLDAFKVIPGWTGELSRLNLDAYASLGTYLPGETVYRQARSLPPASYAWVKINSLTPKVSTYWRFDFSKKSTVSFDTALEQFGELISDAVDIRLRADVPIALTFSGGVDSGIIAAVAKKFSGKQLSCWTIDYDTVDDRSEEAAIARRVAVELGLKWHFKHFDYHKELLPALRSALEFIDQPCCHISISYSRALYAAIRSEAKVVLSGNGADELFLGYNGNEQLVAKDFANTPSSRFANWWLKNVSGKSESHLKQRHKFFADYQTDYIRAKLGNYPEDGDTEARILDIHQDIVASGVTSYADLYTYMGLRYYTAESNFRIPDIIGLSEQVEVRSPFLDHRIVEFAAALPSEFKVGDTSCPDRNKLLLKTFYEKHVPADVAWASKKGMGWNLQYGKALANEPKLINAYAKLLESISVAGLPTVKYRQAWQDFIRDKRQGQACPPSAGTMSAGFMLGLWLNRNQERGRAD